MKRYIYCALIALLTLSCNHSDDPLDNTLNGNPMTLYAKIPQVESRAINEHQPESWEESETINSRTYAIIDPNESSEYFQYWSTNDAISLFFTESTNIKYNLTSLKDNDTGIFTTNEEVTIPTTGYYYSVYPYNENTIYLGEGLINYTFPNTQSYNFDHNDSYANGANGMAAIEPAVGTDYVLDFKNFCSYLQVRLKANTDGNKDGNTVKQIILEANDPDNKIAGNAYIYFEDEKPVVMMDPENSTNRITLDCGTQGVELNSSNTNFWFVLPGDIIFTKGFNITVILKDGTFFRKSKVTNDLITIERNHIQPMASLTVNNIEPTAPIRYTYNNPESDKNEFPINNDFYDAEGNPIYVSKQEFINNEWHVYLTGDLYTIGGNIFEDELNVNHDINKITVDVGSTINIDDYAFYKCTADQIEILSAVETIGQNAFAYCTATELNFAQGINTISDNGFLSCANLTTIDIGSPGVQHIGNNAFRDLDLLQSISLDGIMTIGYAAFQGCTGLTSIEIPATCESIGEGAFVATGINNVTCYRTTPPKILTNNQSNAYVFVEGTNIYVPNRTKYLTAPYWNLRKNGKYVYNYITLS